MKRPWFLLSLILLAGLILRLWGLRWGLPGESRFYHGISYHPDEQAVFYALKQMDWRRGRLYPTEPSIILKGTLQTYTVGAALALASPWLNLSRDEKFYRHHPKALGQIYLVGRMVSVAQSLLAILAIFYLARILWGWRAGLAAAGLLAVAPVHVVNAHYIATDSAFCLYLLFLAMACTFILTSGGSKIYFVAGVLCGLLTANKYNAITSGILILMSHALSVAPTKQHRGLLWAFMGSIGGFLAGCPAVVLGFADWWHGMTMSLQANLQLRHPLADGGYPPQGWWFYTWESARFGLGIPLAIATLVSLGHALLKPEPVLRVWAVWGLIFWLSLVLSPWRLVRWTMPLTLFFFLLIARAWEDPALWRKWKVWQRSLLAAMVLGFTALQSYAYVTRMACSDTRDTSSEWIEQHIPRGAKIGFVVQPYIWEPTIFQAPFFHPEEARALRQDPGYTLIPLHYSLARLNKEKPDYVITSDFRAGVYQINPAQYASLPEGKFLAVLYDSRQYHVVQTFAKRILLGGWDWFGKSARYPHDWRYPFPTIQILERLTEKES